MKNIQLIKNHQVDPNYVASLYHLLHKINTPDLNDHLFCGVGETAIGLIKYGEHLPWIDHLDLGFYTEDNHQSLFDFLKKLLYVGDVASDDLLVKVKMFGDDKYYLLMDLAPSETSVPCEGEEKVSINTLINLLSTESGSYHYSSDPCNRDPLHLNTPLDHIQISYKCPSLSNTIHGFKLEDGAVAKPRLNIYPYYNVGRRMFSRIELDGDCQTVVSLSLSWKKTVLNKVAINVPIDLRAVTIKFYTCLLYTSRCV